ncbi:hypothetical protein J2D73_08385 [Acetobacter sacchari]|uniref:Uncharacterized protein n=1 Tax=Acetobacter sacchari TaxID=2661687 RepID=A0ABS3LV72_9PROT|nr:hypothetical protein [Acetobacter sacchari]MBO1359810.1 hypothetical protein [Acetobacter sacchari]
MSIQGGWVWVDDLGRGASNVACSGVSGCGFLEIGGAFAQAGALRLPKLLRENSQSGHATVWRAGIGGDIVVGEMTCCMRGIHAGPLDVAATIASGGTSTTVAMHGSTGSGRLRRKAASGKDKTPD